MRILNVVGARPNFMKIAPLIKAMDNFSEIDAMLLHTGQHYDEKMSDLFFKQLRLPEPDIYLGVGSASHAVQTAKIMTGIEQVILDKKPDVIVVPGDVNSTLAAALVASKLGVKIAHLEAGLRSFDRKMPEEINRILTDAIADFLFTPSLDGNKHLINEGIPDNKIFFVGNIMIDTLKMFLPKALESNILNTIGLRSKKYALLTLHRPSNVDNKENFIKILNALRVITREINVIFPIHPRTLKQIDIFGLKSMIDEMQNLILTEPLGYFDFLNLEYNAAFILTDSGGLQEESTYFSIPCITIRNNTERPITITEGTNELAGNDTNKILALFERIMNGDWKKGKIPELWDGNTAERIVKILLEKVR